MISCGHGAHPSTTIPRLGLKKIEAWVLAINSADDERNPPETGIEVEAMKRVKNGRLYLIPASAETSGHFTTGNARFYRQQLQEFLQTVPPQAGGRLALSSPSGLQQPVALRPSWMGQ